MLNQRGNVIALVLLLLSVVSLVGAGALLVSRYDLKFTSAVKSYDRGFNVADGAASMSWSDVNKHDREQDMALKDLQNPPAALTIGCHCKDSWKNTSLCTGTTRQTCSRCIDRSQGDFDVQVRLMGYDTQTKAGWEAGSFYDEFWNGNGVAQPTYQTVASSTVEVYIDKVKSSGK